jgi:hypothetical protein
MTIARLRLVAGAALIAVASESPTPAQGPGACGYHLDVYADLTSTHAATADIPFAVGSFGAFVPPGAPGNPYTAWATPGTPVTFRLACPIETLGPLPAGPYNVFSILWTIGFAPFPLPPGPPFAGTCAPGGIVGVYALPIMGALVDGLGIVGPPPITPSVTTPFPGVFEITALLPVGAPFPLTFQAVVVDAAGMVALSNGVSILPGPNPAEMSVLPLLLPSGAGALPLDDGQAVGIPTPAGFAFYGVPAPLFDVDTNGFIDFAIGAMAAGGTDLAGTVGDFGCAVATATARPRVDANHADIDFGIAPPFPLVADLTVEMAPPLPPTPARTIVRWKNAPTFGGGSHRSMVVELWGDSRIVVVRQRMSNAYTAALHDQTGIGPGLAAHGFFGPPPAVATCGVPAGILYDALYGFPGFFGAPGGVVHMDALVSSNLLQNLACVYTPMLLPAPDAYVLNVY